MRPDPPGARQDGRRAAVLDVLCRSAAVPAVRGLRPGRPGEGLAPGRQRRVPVVLPGTGTPVRPVRPARGHLCAPGGGPGLRQLLRPAAAAVRRMRPGPPGPAAGRGRPAGPVRPLRRKAPGHLRGLRAAGTLRYPGRPARLHDLPHLAGARLPVMRPGPARHGVVAGGAPRGRILAALAFLAWLDDRGTTLGAATQADVDDWLHGATHCRYLLRDFLIWASARRLAGQVTVPALPRSELTGLITEDSRWQLLSRCLRDPGIPLDVRTAGALLLLYGQFVSRLTRLTAADIEQHGPDTCLRLDTVPVLLPPRLATLVRAQLDAAPAHPAPRCPGTRPLFPGRSPARPVAPQTLTRRLRQHGIEPRQARNTALAAWASDLPPAVLASLLGVHIQTAVNWASRTRRDWTAYLAERVSAPLLAANRICPLAATKKTP